MPSQALPSGRASCPRVSLPPGDDWRVDIIHPGRLLHRQRARVGSARDEQAHGAAGGRSEEHTSELQSRSDLVCRLLLEKKKIEFNNYISAIIKKKNIYK